MHLFVEALIERRKAILAFFTPGAILLAEAAYSGDPVTQALVIKAVAISVLTAAGVERVRNGVHPDKQPDPGALG